jgi:hypothetical protein
LLTAISHSDPDLQMPPKGGRLPESVISNVKSWIKMGAPDPRINSSGRVQDSSIDIKAARQFWAFKKPIQHEFPVTRDRVWAKQDLDHFVLAKLQANGLAPSSDATPATLLRRLHFDLVGLPPAPKVLDQFRKRIKLNGFDAALASEVDLLLSSDRFGERWGRHWLDVARFAESSGKESNVSFPHAWRYRNYVIDSLNADKAYDRFLMEQIAGDLLPFESAKQREELLIATGFLALGPKGLKEMNRIQYLADVADEQIDTVTRAVMAMTVACARCHDHKFDPFTMEDYYALAGIFVSTKTYIGTSVAPENQIGGDLLSLPKTVGQQIPNKSMPAKQVIRLKAELAALKKEETEGRAAARKAFAEGKDPGKFFSLQTALRILWRTGAIEGKLKTVDEDGRALALAMGVSDRDKVFDVPLLERGEINRAGKTVPRGFPSVISIEHSPQIPKQQSGRLELARWLTHPDHPLTARVMANRVWRHVFGTGIVRTVDNFGSNGEGPSHPKLLDYLARKFTGDGWSIKSLVRDIVLSRTYRQSSTYAKHAFQKDPENRLLWRVSKRRLDAEAIRDAMLAVSGNLETERPVASLVARIGDRPISLIAFDKRVPADLDGSRHRSVYLPVIRDRLPDVLDLFDFAEPSLVTGDRATTNVPLQALYLMNSSFVQEQSGGFAKRVLANSDDAKTRIRYAFVLCFSREPDTVELNWATTFLQSKSNKAGGQRHIIMKSYCQALLSTAEFRNVD